MSDIGKIRAAIHDGENDMTNEGWYTLFSTLVIAAGALLTIVVVVAVIRMIVSWRSPQVQDLEAPVREYMLTDEQKKQYRDMYQ